MLLAAYIFGSYVRGDYDASSDLDVLAIGSPPDNRSVVPLLGHLPTDKLAVSWYGPSRLRRMFADGDLFAWHLHLESMSLIENGFRLADLGRPSPYSQAIADIKSFRGILSDIPEQLDLCPANAAYELGVMYVCIRNIAMSASWYLHDGPDFSRHSPFNLEGVARSIDRPSYELAIRCRMAGQRGASLSIAPTADQARLFCEHAILWAVSVEELVTNRINDDRPL